MDKKERLIFYFLLFLLQFVRQVLFILAFIPLSLVSAKFRQRRCFEGQNTRYPGSQSFNKIQAKAILALHVSSEGELEQIRPIVDFYLESGEKLEILFTSESVEKKVERLFLTHSDQVRLLRLPLLSFFPMLCSWVTADRLLLVRYDFYPELLLLSLSKRLFLTEATLKNKVSSPVRNWLRLKFYSLFEKIICASHRDQEAFIQLGFNRSRLFTAPLRLEQISERLSSTEQKLSQYKVFIRWKEFISNHGREEIFIFGNYWEEEKALLLSLLSETKHQAKPPLVFIVPHLIHPEAHWQEHFKSLPIQLVNSLDQEVDFAADKIIVFNVKGILVELYHYAGVAYVGGGFGRSVHSLAEPFVAGCFILCGPKTHRSTEYDYIIEQRSSCLRVLDRMTWPNPLAIEVHPTFVSTNLVKEAINFLK